MSQYTQQEIAYYQQAIAAGYSEQQALAAIMQNRQAQAPAQAAPTAQPTTQPTAVAQAVAQPADLSLFNELAELASEEEDHTTTGGGSIAAAGQCWIRFLSFIEIGLHESKNKAHKPSQIAIIQVELHSPAHMYEKDGVKVPQVLDIRIPKSQGQNSRWPKFVKAVQRALSPTLGYDITHMSQAIGHACLGTIYHNKNDKGDVFANLDIDKQWSFQPARFTNPATGQVEEVQIPPLHGTPAVFMMNNQKLLADPAKMKFMWDSIFVDGYYEKEKADGTKEKISRNYFQKQIAKSIGWEQSPVKKILDSQGCTTTFGETAATGLPSGLAAQVQQVPNAAPQVAQAPVVPQVATAPQVAPAAQVQPVSQMPAPTAMVEQAQPAPVTGVTTAAVQMPQAVAQAPATTPAQATPAVPQDTQQAAPAMDAAAFMAAFNQ